MIFLFISDILAEPSGLEAIKQVESSESITTANEFIQRPNMAYNAQDLRDPFKPYITEENSQEATQESSSVVEGGGAEKPLPSLTVQGLVWGGNFPQAIINHKVLKIDDTIEGATIKQIDKEGVTLIFEGRAHKLPVTVSKRSPY